MTATLNVSPQRQLEPLATQPGVVAWSVAFSPVPGRTVVSVWRPGPVLHLVPALRAGVIRQCTVRVDCSVDELVTAVGVSGLEVSLADPLGVVWAALAGFDRVGTDEVRAITAATRLVLAGQPTIRPDRDRHTAVWPTLADYRQCRATVAAIVDDQVREVA